MGWNSRFSRLNRVFQSTDPVPGNFLGSGNFRFPGSVDCAEFFSRLNHAWKLSGFRFSRLNRVFSRLNHAWAVFQPYSNEEQTLPKCNRTNIGSKGLCQSATRPYMLLDASPKAWSNIHKRILHKFDLKTQKLEYSQKQSKSRANAHEEVLGIHTQQPKIIIVIDMR